MKIIAVSWLGLLVVFAWVLKPAGSLLVNHRQEFPAALAPVNCTNQLAGEMFHFCAAQDVPAAHTSPMNSYLSAVDTRYNSNLEAKATSAPSHQLTPTSLPAEYKVEQTHPAMITGAAILVFIIVVGVLAFSRRKA